MKQIQWKAAIVVTIVVAITYVVLPVLAGVYEIGDRRGPRIYPESFHSQLYLIGWEMTDHSEGKPRLRAHDTTTRPWFYRL